MCLSYVIIMGLICLREGVLQFLKREIHKNNHRSLFSSVLCQSPSSCSNVGFDQQLLVGSVIYHNVYI